MKTSAYLVFENPALKAPHELGSALCNCCSLGS